MIGRIGFRLARSSVEELIDTALEPQEVERIRSVILEVDGVAVHHGDQRVTGRPRPELACEIGARRPGGQLARASVGQDHTDRVAHGC